MQSIFDVVHELAILLLPLVVIVYGRGFRCKIGCVSRGRSNHSDACVAMVLQVVDSLEIQHLSTRGKNEGDENSEFQSIRQVWLQSSVLLRVDQT